MLNGIICINKPEGFTSFDVIAKMRGILKMKKLGHSGTLDPMATGVLPVFIGSATKAISIIPPREKSYRASFKLGINTDTYDITGKIIEEKFFDVKLRDIEEALKNFHGKITQLPPMYSAVQVNGKRLYELARKGIEVERPEREVEINNIQLLEFDENTGEGTIEMTCSKGTYVRSVIYDMGKILNSGAVMTSLVRTSSDGFNIEETVTIERLEKLKDENRLDEFIKPVEKLFTMLPEIKLSEQKTTMYKNGVKLRLDKLKLPDNVATLRVYGFNGEFIGIAKVDYDNNALRVLKNLSGESK